MDPSATFVFSLVVCLTLILCPSLPSIATASQSPIFSYNHLGDPPSDWREFYSGAPKEKGNLSTDLLDITYFSDGANLYTTLWLAGPFESEPTGEVERVSYGIFIDADANRSTGPNGIDYKLELSWSNKIWTITLEQWSSTGEVRQISHTVLSPSDKNSSSYFVDGKHYVNLSLDLASVGSPERYRVLYYTEWKGVGINDFYTDVTRWVNFPPPKFVISTIPTALVLKQGEDANLEVQLKSTSDIEPTVALSPEGIQTKVIESFEFDPARIRVPPNGITTSNLHIKISDSAPLGPHTIIVLTNSTFSEGSIFNESNESPFQQNAGQLGKAVSSAENENVIDETTFLITVEKSTSIDEVLLGLYTKYGALAGTIVAFLGIAKQVRKKMISLLRRAFKMRSSKQGERSP